MGFLDTITRGFGQMLNPSTSIAGRFNSAVMPGARSFMTSILPNAAGALGGYLGGPTGAAIGEAGGGFLSSLLGGSGNPMSNIGSTIASGLRSAIPAGFGNSSFGNMFNNFRNQAGDYINQGLSRVNPMLGGLGLGGQAVNAGSGFLSDLLGRIAPGAMDYLSGFSGTTPNQAANGFGGAINNAMPRGYGDYMPGGFSARGGEYTGPMTAPGRYTTNPGMGPVYS